MSQAWITGVGQTSFSRKSGVEVDVLAREASLAAMQDAGVTPSDVDGLVTYPSGARAEDVIVPFGLDISFSAISQLGGASSVASLQIAVAALEAGRAERVLVLFARNGSSQQRIGDRVGSILPNPAFRQTVEGPLGATTPAQWYALICRRHMHDFGTTKRDLGAIAMTMRANAQRNAKAQMHGRPMSMEDYLGARPIAVPYHLLDCSLETDGAVALVVSSDPTAPNRGIRIAGVAEGRPAEPDELANRADIYDTGLARAAPRALDEAGVRLDDLDLALIYDCFTFEVLHQLEDMGVCERGEGGDFVSGGAIQLDGRLPVNPHGGLLSEGHLGGMNHIAEGVRQLRHACGDRQVKDAQAAVVTGYGDFGDGSMAVLVRD